MQMYLGVGLPHGAHSGHHGHGNAHSSTPYALAQNPHPYSHRPAHPSPLLPVPTSNSYTLPHSNSHSARNSSGTTTQLQSQSQSSQTQMKMQPQTQIQMYCQSTSSTDSNNIPDVPHLMPYTTALVQHTKCPPYVQYPPTNGPYSALVRQGRKNELQQRGKKKCVSGGVEGRMSKKKRCREMCIHGRIRYYCSDCGGGGVCIHGRQRYHCSDCGGGGICIHGRNRSFCSDCGGGGMCIHGRRRYHCSDCPHKVIPQTLCLICVETSVSGKRKGGMCAKCDPKGVSKIDTREAIMRKMITEELGFEPSLIDKAIRGNSCKDLERRRPDFVYVLSNFAIVIEIDEDSHESYDSSCEVAKISQQTDAIQKCDGLLNADVITIRLNPDAYHKGRVRRKTRAKAVADRVKKIIKEYEEKGDYERSCYSRVEYFYYHKNSNHHIDAQKEICPILVFPK